MLQQEKYVGVMRGGVIEIIVGCVFNEGLERKGLFLLQEGLQA
jgi:hypothetical protein